MSSHESLLASVFNSRVGLVSQAVPARLVLLGRKISEVVRRCPIFSVRAKVATRDQGDGVCGK